MYIYRVASKLVTFVINMMHFENSLKDSNANSKVEISEKEGIVVCFLICGILGLKKACWSSKMETRKNDKWVNYSLELTQIK